MHQPDQQLVVSTDLRGPAAVVAVRGEIDMATSAQLRAALVDAVAVAPEVVVADLSGVGFLSSSGLRELLAARSAAQDRGVRLVLSGTPQPVRRVLDLTETTQLFTLTTTVAEALG